MQIAAGSVPLCLCVRSGDAHALCSKQSTLAQKNTRTQITHTLFQCNIIDIRYKPFRSGNNWQLNVHESFGAAADGVQTGVVRGNFADLWPHCNNPIVSSSSPSLFRCRCVHRAVGMSFVNHDFITSFPVVSVVVVVCTHNAPLGARMWVSGCGPLHQRACTKRDVAALADDEHFTNPRLICIDW